MGGRSCFPLRAGSTGCLALGDNDFLPGEKLACWGSTLASGALSTNAILAAKIIDAATVQKMGDFSCCQLTVVISSNTKYLYSFCQLQQYVFNLLNMTLLESAWPIGKTCFAQIFEGRGLLLKKAIILGGIGESAECAVPQERFPLISCLLNL